MTSLALCLIFAIAASANDESTPLSIHDLKAACRLGADTNVNPFPEHVTIRGIVTWHADDSTMPGYLTMQDSSGAIWVNVNLARQLGVWAGADDTWRTIAPGDSIVATGFVDTTGYAPMLIPSTVAHVADPSDDWKPEPRQPDKNSFFSGSEDCSLVTVVGVLRGFRKDPERWILVLGWESQQFFATIPRECLSEAPSHLVDSVVALTGVATSRFTTRGQFVSPTIHLRRADDLEIVSPPENDAFSAPFFPLRNLARYNPTPPSRHRISSEGIVTYCLPGEFLYLQEGATGVRIETSATDSYAPGERVRVAGFLDSSRVLAGVSEAASLVEATIKRVGNTEPVPITSISPDEISHLNRRAQQNGLLANPGDYDGCLIEFPARLMEIRQTTPGAALLVSTGETTLPVLIPFATAFTAVRSIPINSELRIRGIVQFDLQSPLGGRPMWHLPVVETMAVFARSAEDVEIVRRPSWWTPIRLGIALATVALGLVATLTWATVLRREVATQAVKLAAEMKSRHEAAVGFRATLRERNRLAANLHDTLLQSLSAIGMQLQACELGIIRGLVPAGEEIGRARTIVDHAVAELRESVWVLRTFPLQGKTFIQSLHTFTDSVAKQHSVAVHLHSDPGCSSVSEHVASTLFLVVQEAVRNAIHHGVARTVTIHIWPVAATKTIHVTVADDGCGFDTDSVSGPTQGHFGLYGMRERIERLGGTFSLLTTPGHGTTITITAPAQAEGDDFEG